MAGTGTVTSLGVYIETRTKSVLDTSFGVYIEQLSQIQTVTSFGCYIEENWDASPIIVSTDGEETPIFGLVVR